VTACILLFALIRIRKALKTQNNIINEKNMAIHLIAFFLYVVIALCDKIYVVWDHDNAVNTIVKVYKVLFAQTLLSFFSQVILLYIFW
jgi:hypothetical protein